MNNESKITENKFDTMLYDTVKQNVKKIITKYDMDEKDKKILNHLLEISKDEQEERNNFYMLSPTVDILEINDNITKMFFKQSELGSVYEKLEGDLLHNLIFTMNYMKLEHRDALILLLKIHGWTKNSIAKIVKLSTDRVSQIISKNIRRIKYYYKMQMLLQGEKFLNFSRIDEVSKVKKPSEKSNLTLESISIEEADFSIRATNCLKRARFKNLDEVARLTDDELFSLRNMGRKSVKEIRTKLKELETVYGKMQIVDNNKSTEERLRRISEAKSIVETLRYDYNIRKDAYCSYEREVIRKYTLCCISDEKFKQELKEVYESYINR